MKPTLALALALGWSLLGSPAAAQTTTLADTSAYCCIGAGGGYCRFTASGQQVRPGAVAAAPHVPFGSLVSIPGYPWQGIVLDRGGAIWGNRLDVFFPSCSDAIAWGRRTVPVTWVGAITPEAAWIEILSEETYFDVDYWVTKRVTDSNRGLATTYEVHR